MEENKDIETEMTEPLPKDAEAENAEVTETPAEDVEAENIQQTEETEQEEGKKSYKGMTSTKNGLTIRALIGAFILYYAYSIASDITSTPAGQRTPLYVFIAVFVIAGILIIADSVKRLIKKEYDH